MRDNNFLFSLNGLKEKPGRTDDAWMLYQLAKKSSAFSGDFVFIGPEDWAVLLCGRIAREQEKGLYVFANGIDNQMSMSRLIMEDGLTGTARCGTVDNSSFGVGKEWGLVYMNDRELSPFFADHVHEHLGHGGMVLAGEGCEAFFPVMVGVVELKLSNYQTLYFTR